MIDCENVVDAMLFEARVAMLDGEMLEVESYQLSDCMTHLMEKLRQAQKDAARYRWLRDEAQEQDLHVITSLESLEWDSFIDGAMQCER